LSKLRISQVRFSFNAYCQVVSACSHPEQSGFARSCCSNSAVNWLIPILERLAAGYTSS
jgi:hypothetical protein